MKIFCNSCSYEVRVRDGLRLVGFFVSFFSRFRSFTEAAREWVRKNRASFEGYKPSFEIMEKNFVFFYNHRMFYPDGFWGKTRWADFVAYLLSDEVFSEGEEERFKNRFSPGNFYATELYDVVLHDMVQWFFDGERNSAVKKLTAGQVFAFVSDLVGCMTTVAGKANEEFYPDGDDPFGGFKSPELVANQPNHPDVKNLHFDWLGTSSLPDGATVIRDRSSSGKYMAFLSPEGLAVEKYRGSCLEKEVLDFLDKI